MVRFIANIFFIWKGDKSSLATFIKYIKGVESSIKFTHEKSFKSVNFLDTKVIKDVQGNISTGIFQKPTDTHPYLHWTSAYPPHLKKSIPYSQGLGLRRICSSTTILEQRILEYSNFFIACGYKRERTLSEMRKVLSLTQDESLRVRERHTTSRIPFVTTYNPRISYIAEVVNRNWHFLNVALSTLESRAICSLVRVPVHSCPLHYFYQLQKKCTLQLFLERERERDSDQ